MADYCGEFLFMNKSFSCECLLAWCLICVLTGFHFPSCAALFCRSLWTWWFHCHHHSDNDRLSVKSDHCRNVPLSAIEVMWSIWSLYCTTLQLLYRTLCYSHVLFLQIKLKNHLYRFMMSWEISSLILNQSKLPGILIRSVQVLDVILYNSMVLNSLCAQDALQCGFTDVFVQAWMFVCAWTLLTCTNQSNKMCWETKVHLISWCHFVKKYNVNWLVFMFSLSVTFTSVTKIIRFLFQTLSSSFFNKVEKSI